MLKPLIAGIVRHILTTLGGGIVADGYISNDDLTTFIGALFTIAGIVWSAWHKYKAAQQLKAAETGVDVAPNPPYAWPKIDNSKGGAGKLLPLLVLGLGISGLTSGVKAQTFWQPGAPIRFEKLTLGSGHRPNATSEVVGDEAAGVSPVTNTNSTSPSLQGGLQMLLDAATSGKTNWYAVPYALYAPGLSHKWGGGLGIFWPVSDYFLAGCRMDYVDGDFWMPSGNATIQVPLHLGPVNFTPFTYAGVGVPLSGAKVGDFTIPGSVRDNNGQITGILGYGLAVQIYKTEKWSIGLIADAERWTGFDGQQYRGGVVANLKL